MMRRTGDPGRMKLFAIQDLVLSAKYCWTCVMKQLGNVLNVINPEGSIFCVLPVMWSPEMDEPINDWKIERC